jgi:reverse gyrase
MQDLEIIYLNFRDNQKATMDELLSGKIKLNQITPEDVNKIFERFGFKPWGAQRLWARKFLKGESFAMLAPTGSGKTTTTIALALLKKSLILLPNSTLAYQVAQKIQSVAEDKKIVQIHSLAKKPSLEDVIDADVIITTSASIVRNKKLFEQVKVDAVFVDDVDGFLRRSQAIDTVLKILGITDEQIETAKKIVSRKIEDEELSEAYSKIKINKGQIVISGATQTAKRTLRVRILREIFGFDIGQSYSFARNIIDSYLIPEKSMEEHLVELIQKLGRGAIVYVRGSEKAEQLAEYLVQNGIKASAYVKASKKIFQAFENGEIDVLVGTSSRRSSLVRGIDLPTALRYTIFFEIPRVSISIDRETFSPRKMIMVISHIARHLEGEERQKAIDIIENLSKIVDLTQANLEKIRAKNFDPNSEKVSDFMRFAYSVMMESLEFFNSVSSKPEIVEKTGISGNSLITPDSFAYIQASGRTSRLTIGGLTKGLSILMVDDLKAFELMKAQLEPLDVEFVNVKEIDLEKVIEEINLTRELKVGVDIEFNSRLLIVESPTKSRTISYFFGKPLRSRVDGMQVFEVMAPNMLLLVTASRGHITDLAIRQPSFGAKLVDSKLEVKFEITKPDVVSSLQKLAENVDEVLVATDPDAEGEKIAWDLRCLLYPFNQNIKRLRWHEITKRAIVEGIANPEEFDLNLLKAQILRKVEDAWIGLELSQVVQKKFNREDLSAGRVQTPVLGWVCERTKESKKKIAQVNVNLENNLRLTFTSQPEKVDEIKSVEKVLIFDLAEEIVEQNPLPPYTTDSLLQDGIYNLNLPASDVMALAQELFESGLITYHRTDSTRVSSFGVNLAKQYLERENLGNYFKPRTWATEEGAHECIRPTRPLNSFELETDIDAKLLLLQTKLSKKHIKLYDLIFKRFIASQMSPAKVKVLKFKSRLGDIVQDFQFNGAVVENGFNLISPIKTTGEIKEGEYKISQIQVRLISEKPLYTEANLIQLMREKKIGRPSTYAPTVQKLKDRGYVQSFNGRLAGTRLGFNVFNFLISKYEPLINEERTRIVLEAVDKIERGEENFIDKVIEFRREVEDLLKKKFYVKR